MKRIALGLCLLSLSFGALARGIWTEPVAALGDNVYVVAFGERDGTILDYDANRIAGIRALDAYGERLTMDWQRMDAAILLQPQGEVGVLTLAYDDGYSSLLENGRWVNRAMNEVKSRPQKGVHRLGYHKYQVAFTPAALAIQGQPLELLLTERPVAGEPFTVQVLREGQPVAGAEVALKGESDALLSDTSGFVELTAFAGLNQVWAHSQTELIGDDRATEADMTAILVFSAAER